MSIPTSARRAARYARQREPCGDVRVSCARSTRSPSPTRRSSFGPSAWRSIWPWLPGSVRTCTSTRSATRTASKLGSPATRGPAAGAPRHRLPAAGAGPLAHGPRSSTTAAARLSREPRRRRRMRPTRRGYGGFCRPRRSLGLRPRSGRRRLCRDTSARSSTVVTAGRVASRSLRSRSRRASDRRRTAPRRRFRGWARLLPRSSLSVRPNRARRASPTSAMGLPLHARHSLPGKRLGRSGGSAVQAVWNALSAPARGSLRGTRIKFATTRWDVHSGARGVRASSCARSSRARHARPTSAMGPPLRTRRRPSRSRLRRRRRRRCLGQRTFRGSRRSGWTRTLRHQGLWHRRSRRRSRRRAEASSLPARPSWRRHRSCRPRRGSGPTRFPASLASRTGRERTRTRRVIRALLQAAPRRAIAPRQRGSRRATGLRHRLPHRSHRHATGLRRRLPHRSPRCGALAFAWRSSGATCRPRRGRPVAAAAERLSDVTSRRRRHRRSPGRPRRPRPMDRPLYRGSSLDPGGHGT